jgi:Anti-sigma-K factor rskA, C-terminal
MTDDHGDMQENDALDALLARSEVWEDPPPELEDRVVAAIMAEARSAQAAPASAVPASGTDVTGAEATRSGDELARRRARRGGTSGARRRLTLVAAAAVIALGALGVLVVAGGGDDSDGPAAVELTGTDLAPSASAVAEIQSTPLGVKIVLDVEGLPGAPPGMYYQAWLRSEDDGVSAGTFHLRGGDGAIELWGGVDDPKYSVITVTLQDEGGGAESSGRVVLRGEWDR